MKRLAPASILILGAVVMTQACASLHHSFSFDPGSIDPEKHLAKIDQLEAHIERLEEEIL